MDHTLLSQKAEMIFNAGLEAVDPIGCMQRHLRLDDDDLLVGGRCYRLAEIRHIYVIGAGKAAALMAKAVEGILAGLISDGIVVTKYGHGVALDRVRVIEAGHPVPDENGVKGAEAILNLLAGAQHTDLILALISGGGSALMTAPANGLTLDEKQATTRALLACGASIDEINVIRKHMSRIKGGQLCRAVNGAAMTALILSDVIGDDVQTIASGATAVDNSTFDQCREIIDRYELSGKIPHSVWKRIENGCHGNVSETPKSGDEACAKVHNVIIGCLADAIRACCEKARQIGFSPLILSSRIQGEAREVAKVLCAVAKEAQHSGNPVKPPACLLSGGETTVTLKGNGKGGRNMELALSAALELEGTRRIVLLSAGTDGTDGPTDAAGAFADGTSVENAHRRGLSAVQMLKNNDAYPFFKKINGLLITGPTRTNVMDLQIVLVDS